MKDNICLQCNKLLVKTSTRLVQDTCGHKKCRICLLEDEEKCKQCEIEAKSKNVKQNGTPDKTVLKKYGVIQKYGNGSVAVEKSTSEENIIIQEASISPENKIIEQITEKTTAVAVDQKKKESVPKIKRNYKVISIPSHIIESADPVSYYCTICRKKFNTRCHVKYHRFCAEKDLKPFKCDTCDKQFILKSQLHNHQYKHNGVKPFVCNICQKPFAEKHKLSRHIIIHTSSRPHVCTDCGKSFKSKESLRLHKFIHNEEKPYTCPICSSRFNNSSNLNKHIASHSKEKVHMCDQCGKRFKLKWALVVHRKTHLRTRPHQCTTCSKSFINKKDLQRHNLIHAEVKGFMCSICRTVFGRKDNLYRHMKNSHPGKKGEVIRNVSKPADLEHKKQVIDNPNAIKVITASPAFTKTKAETEQPVKSTDSRPGTVINGPIKLAFKTPAFKSNYNISRDFNYIPPYQSQKPFDLAESVDICQKILSPHTSSSLSRNVNVRKPDDPTSTEICQKILSPFSTPVRKIDEQTSTEICQKILSPHSSSAPIHYETSFLNRKHAKIKNIKFKVPDQYTNNFKQNEISLKDIAPLKPVEIIANSEDASKCTTYAELKPVPIATTSVIVNNNASQGSEVHWRRRTSQNLALKS